MKMKDELPVGQIWQALSSSNHEDQSRAPGGPLFCKRCLRRIMKIEVEPLVGQFLQAVFDEIMKMTIEPSLDEHETLRNSKLSLDTRQTGREKNEQMEPANQR